MTGFIMPILFFVLQFFPSTKAWGDNLTTICRILFPSFCFGDSLYKMAFRRVITVIAEEKELIDVWDSRVSG